MMHNMFFFAVHVHREEKRKIAVTPGLIEFWKGKMWADIKHFNTPQYQMSLIISNTKMAH